MAPEKQPAEDSYAVFICRGKLYRITICPWCGVYRVVTEVDGKEVERRLVEPTMPVDKLLWKLVFEKAEE